LEASLPSLTPGSLLAAGTSRLAFAAQLVPFKAKLKRTFKQRHDLREAGRCGSTTAETQDSKAAKAAQDSPPRMAG